MYVPKWTKCFNVITSFCYYFMLALHFIGLVGNSLVLELPSLHIRIFYKSLEHEKTTPQGRNDFWIPGWSCHSCFNIIIMTVYIRWILISWTCCVPVTLDSYVKISIFSTEQSRIFIILWNTQRYTCTRDTQNQAKTCLWEYCVDKFCCQMSSFEIGYPWEWM